MIYGHIPSPTAEELRAEVTRLEELVERLRIEAQTHAQEARTQRATVHECYRIATGGKGEPGDWHGAEPVRKMAERLAAAEARAEDADVLTDDMLRYAMAALGTNCPADADLYRAFWFHAITMRESQRKLAEGEAG